MVTVASFDRAVLIFNPHSSGNALEKAQELRDELSARLPELLVELVATQHAGHARELARDAAASGRPLTVGRGASWDELAHLRPTPL
jgi:diacylglycerol kinase family enzyme